MIHLSSAELQARAPRTTAVISMLVDNVESPETLPAVMCQGFTGAAIMEAARLAGANQQIAAAEALLRSAQDMMPNGEAIQSVLQGAAAKAVVEAFGITEYNARLEPTPS